MKKSHILLLIFAILLSSCRPVMMKYYGIKKPRIENEQSLIRKDKRFGFGTNNIVSSNSDNFLHILNGQGIPDAKIYAKFGNYIEFKSNDSACNAELSEFIQNLHKDTIYKTSEYPNFFEEYSKYRDLKGNDLPKPNSADFYIVIFWTAWTGRLNKTHVKIGEELAKENKNCEIEVLKLNLDIQNHWNKEERERIIKVFSY